MKLIVLILTIIIIGSFSKGMDDVIEKDMKNITIVKNVNEE